MKLKDMIPFMLIAMGYLVYFGWADLTPFGIPQSMGWIFPALGLAWIILPKIFEELDWSSASYSSGDDEEPEVSVPRELEPIQEAQKLDHNQIVAYKCANCAGPLEVRYAGQIIPCSYCGTKNRIVS